MLKISKEDFCRAISVMEKFDNFQDRLRDILGDALLLTEIPAVDDLYLEIEHLLCLMCNINEHSESSIKYGTDISYFIYDLDYGRKWKPECLTYYEKDIPLRTAEDLYDFLVLQDKEGEENE